MLILLMESHKVALQGFRILIQPNCLGVLTVMNSTVRPISNEIVDMYLASRVGNGSANADGQPPP